MDHSRSQADEPLLLAGELRLPLSEYIAVVRIVFGEWDEGNGYGEGETASAEEGYEVRENRKKST